jgi:hypothetical protein
MGLDCAINAVELVTGIKGKVEVTK